MLPKSYLIFKWSVYGTATAGLFALQYLLFNHIHPFGITPFIYPMLPAVLASFEGLRRGSIFGLVLGAVCDILLVGPFDGFYTVLFTLIALLSALIAEHLLAPGFLCGLAVSSMAFALTDLLRIVVELMKGNTYLLLMLRTTVLETLLSLPALVIVVPLYRVICKKCATDY